MFSGIIQQLGEIKLLTTINNTENKKKKSAKKINYGVRSFIKCSLKIFPRLKIGESIAVDGVCLTVIKIANNGFAVEVSPETINVCKENLFEQKNIVNLERAMRYGDVVGGHLVSGHIDGVGEVKKINLVGENKNSFTEITFKSPKKLITYLVEKGCIAINGVSLTVNYVRGDKFTVMLIPHTLKITNLGLLKVGDLINLEVDLMAKYFLKNNRYLKIDK